MTYRKKKLLLIQISLLFIGIFIIFFTYLQKKKSDKRNIKSKESKKKNRVKLG